MFLLLILGNSSLCFLSLYHYVLFFMFSWWVDPSHGYLTIPLPIPEFSLCLSDTRIATQLFGGRVCMAVFICQLSTFPFPDTYSASLADNTELRLRNPIQASVFIRGMITGKIGLNSATVLTI
jgi:hypothetical protein